MRAIDFGMYSSFIEESTGTRMPLVRIDSIGKCKDATFIKMDINMGIAENVLYAVI